MNAAEQVETDRERFLRLARPYRRDWLAEQLGIGADSLSLRFSGKVKWRRLELVRLAEIWGVSFEYLQSSEDMAS